MRHSPNQGRGPIYALRHPSLRVATFWPRLAIRKATNSTSELLAVASTDDTVVLFPTSERYNTKSALTVPALHDPLQNDQSESPLASKSTRSRPHLQRAPTSSFTTLFSKTRVEEDNLPVYCHGTPLVGGHLKEVTSVAWSSEGNLITASDDFLLRCWRENATEARRLRGLNQEKDFAALVGHGWSNVGIKDWDEEY